MRDRAPWDLDLLERDAQLDAVDWALALAAEEAEGMFVAFEGEAGAGKTVLLSAAGRRADGLGFKVLRARSTRLETPVAYGVAVQLLDAAVALERIDSNDLLAGAGGLARPLFDSPPPAEPVPDDGFSLIRGLATVTIELARRQPALLLVDDLQWADRPSLRFLHHLTLRLPGEPIVVVASIRPLTRTDWTVPELRWLGRELVVPLPPLSEEAVATLVRGALPTASEELAAVTYRATGGVPNLVTQMVATMRDPGSKLPPTPEHVGDLVPDATRRLVNMRLAELPADAKRLAAGLAVLGERSDLTVAAEAGVVSGERIGPALDALTDAGFVGRGQGCGADRPILRAAVYDELRADERDSLHRRVAMALVRHGAPFEEAAGHLLRTQPRGEDWVVSALWAAGDRARARGEAAAAVEYLRRALDEPPLSDVRGDLLCDLGSVEASLGDKLALTHLREAITLARDPARQAEAWYEIGSLQRCAGDLIGAAEAFEHGLAANVPLHANVAARLRAALAAIAHLHPGIPSPHHGAVETTACESDSAYADLVRRSEAAFAEVVDGADHVRVRMAACAALADGRLLAHEGPSGAALQQTVVTLIWSDSFAEAEAAIADALAAAAQSGATMAAATLHFYRSLLHHRVGDVAGAVTDAQQALVTAAGGWSGYLPAARAILVHGLLEQAELRSAAGVMSSSEDAHDEPTPMSAEWCEAKGRVLALAGDHDAALTEFLAAGRIAEDGLRWRNPACYAWRSHAALAYLALGDSDAAFALAEHEVDLARRFGAPRALGRALRVSGTVLGSAGIARLEEAVSVLRESPARLERAKAELALGAALARRGRHDGAVRHLKVAVSIATDCGAVAAAQRARTELHAAGGHAPGARRGAGALTPAERRVADLAREGLTNKEIASQLFISVKGVEYHLGNAYTKLGIHSRVELPRVLDPR